MQGPHCAPAWLQSRIRGGEELSSAVGVLLVANVKGRTTPADDYDGDSIISEFLSATELDDIVSYFEGGGFYCEVVLDEEGFMKWIAERRTSFPRQQVLVYNLAQNGTGRARLSLVAGLCRLHGLLLLDSDAYSVAIAHHKFHCLSLLAGFGLNVPPCWSFSQNGWWPSPPPTGLRLIAKPTYESASLGVGHDSVFTMNAGAEEHLLRKIAAYRQAMTVQEFIPGFEVEVPVFEADVPRSLAAVGIALGAERDLADRILSYERVFADKYSFYDFEEQNAVAAGEARRIAEKAFRCLELCGVGRVDFRIPKYGPPLIIEVNCKPHITKHSSVLVSLSTVDLSGIELAKYLVGTAGQRHRLAP